MIIGVDGNEANINTRVGVSWTTFYLLNEFARLANDKLHFKIFLKSTPVADLPKQNKFFQYVIVPKKTVWSQIDLPINLFLKHRNLTVFLAPAHYSPRFCPCPTVVIVYDLSYFYYPQDFLQKDLYQLINWTLYSVKKAKAVIACSDSTKQDVIINYHLPENKVNLIYNGFIKPKIKPAVPEFQIKQPYFLALGTLQPRKNITTLIKAFAKLNELNPQTHLYLAGKKGWLYDEIELLIKKQRLTNNITLTGYLDEPQKWFLLERAKALIMPGWYEGFGMPILEAFSVNTPVICSQSASLPEVAAEAGLYFDPESPNELFIQMQKLLKNDNLAKDLVLKGKTRLKNFSWEKAAKQIIQILAG